MTYLELIERVEKENSENGTGLGRSEEDQSKERLLQDGRHRQDQRRGVPEEHLEKDHSLQAR